MDLWLWAIAAILGTALLRRLLSRYRQNGNQENRNEEHTYPSLSQSGEPVYPVSPFGVSSEAYRRSRADDESTDENRRRCPRCGTYNTASPAFTYCRECVRPLS